MTKGLVFGKFLPFHKGHEAMIRFACTKCDHLNVLVCYEKAEAISGDIRKNWIVRTFVALKKVHVDILRYNEDMLPNTSKTSIDASKLWAREFEGLYPDCNVLITSEPYGQLVADFMGIRHISFDPGRKQFPVSASHINKNVFASWSYLPTAVRGFFAMKIIVLGTESSGKTTLVKALGTHFGCATVMEAGRDLIPDSRNFDFNDLLIVADEHKRRILSAEISANPLLIVDTDIHITMSYARFLFNKELDVEKDTLLVNRGHLYLYLTNDVPYHQDGTRLDEGERNKLDHSHRKVLEDYGINYVELPGTWQRKFDGAIAEVSKVLIRLGL